ncbi:hypothetical protein PV516_19030 [Streptomyces scabiei]|uniref:hypothetical protein n=1 Tax=Streptomyces scabiei TaxID=1930 RepID=UPI0029A0A155|nr:hypothetical protein [Streptomyces scabiei]MDX3165882.1 hypothetical protein [Streptomyces scabiei]
MDSHTAPNQAAADRTPRPWDYTAPGDITTLTVVPAGLRADPGCAEVRVRISALGQFFDADAGIPSRDIPAMIDALTANQQWSYDTPDDVGVELAPSTRSGMWLTLSVDLEADDEPQIHIPETLRLPLTSVLQAALTVARGWES